MTERVAVVLSGAAARGPFQAGALQELIPALHDQGLEPKIFLGTSAGSINATLWGQSAHLGPERAGDAVVGTWSRMGRANVIAHPIRTVLFGDAPKFVASAVGIAPGLASLLDTGPLARTAHEVLDPKQLTRNVADGVIDAVGVVASRIPPPSKRPAQEGPAHARTVVFIDSTLDVAAVADPIRAVDVARGPIDASHVLASSAIPIAFSPVKVERPGPFRGWYSDGGVRLNTPLRPAVALGADRILVVSAMSTEIGAPLPPSHPDAPMPTIADTGATVLHSVLGDQLTEDLHTLRGVNRMVTEQAGADELTRANGTPWRVIPVMTVSPSPGELAVLAERIADEALNQSLFTRWRSSDVYALDRLLRGLGDGAGRRELLSYVLFNTDYFAAQVDLGRRAAQQALAGGWLA